METLTFKLSGKTGFFKQPDVNTYQYYTYGHIHKVALLGIFGAILGLDGYNQQNKSDSFPEFYAQLQHLKVAIQPLNEEGYIPKKVQVFNNSVGYASKEEGGNLIVKEQWLEMPAWQIYLLFDNLEADVLLQDLKSRFLEKRFVYLPYLGKNDHYANIEGIEVYPLKAQSPDSPVRIHSLFPKLSGTLVPQDHLFLDDTEALDFKYEERLPLAIDPDSNQYQTIPFVYTNIPVKLLDTTTVHQTAQNNLIFF